MSRNDFLKNLREALSQSLDNQTVNNQIDYYDKYISDEINKGRSEKEVLDELGDPRLIAKTIQTVNRAGNIVQDENTSNTYNNSDQNSYDNGNQNRNRSKTFYTNMSSTSIIGCVIVLLVIFIIIAFILQMFGVVFMGLTGIISKTGLGFIVLIAIMVWLVLRRK